MKNQPSHRIFEGKSIEIYEHLQFYLRFKPSEFMGKAMVSRWFPFFPFKSQVELDSGASEMAMISGRCTTLF